MGAVKEGGEVDKIGEGEESESAERLGGGVKGVQLLDNWPSDFSSNC